MQVLKIQEELTKVVGISRSQREGMDSFKVRVIKLVGTISEDVWDQLSTETQDWYNLAVIARNEKKPLPQFPGEKELPPEELLPPRKRKKSGEKKLRAVREIYRLLSENPKMTVDEIRAALAALGITVVTPTISGKRRAFRTVARALIAAGKLKMEL